jgi:hypothetical protein
MRANAVSCIVFAIIFFIFPGEVSSFLSSTMKVPEMFLIALGIALFFNGIHLIFASLNSMPSKLIIHYFSIGDYIWVVGTTYLLLSGTWITSSSGILVTILVSLMVGSFGILQMLKRKEIADF